MSPHTERHTRKNAGVAPTLGRCIARRRHQLGLTRAELAVLAHCSERTIRNFETDAALPSEEREKFLEQALAWQAGAVSDILTGDGSSGIPHEHPHRYGTRSGGLPPWDVPPPNREMEWTAAKTKRDAGLRAHVQRTGEKQAWKWT